MRIAPEYVVQSIDKNQKTPSTGLDLEAVVGEVRDDEGRILPNKNFPDMPALTGFIHALGLKAGIYSSPGPRTCQQFEGSYGHEEMDAKIYADCRQAHRPRRSPRLCRPPPRCCQRPLIRLCMERESNGLLETLPIAAWHGVHFMLNAGWDGAPKGQSSNMDCAEIAWPFSGTNSWRFTPRIFSTTPLRRNPSGPSVTRRRPISRPLASTTTPL